MNLADVLEKLDAEQRMYLLTQRRLEVRLSRAIDLTSHRRMKREYNELVRNYAPVLYREKMRLK